MLLLNSLSGALVAKATKANDFIVYPGYCCAFASVNFRPLR
jgi:hypothetical protein